MAEQVQLHLEARLPELKDLLKRGLFSEEEIRNVVIQRTKYEYRLKRRGAILEDFLAYIEYEKQLEVERRDRAHRSKSKSLQTLSEYSLVQHVYALYQRALVKFKGDASLWIQFLDYAILQGSRQVFSKGVNRALQVHPLHAPLWIMAARWQWMENGNMTAARALLQRGLRTDSTSTSLWLSFFELEIDFAIKVGERRSILGIQEGSVSQHDTVKEEEHEQSVLDGAIAIVVFDHCIKSVPSISAKEVARFFNIANSSADKLPFVKEAVIRSFLKQFGDKADYTYALAHAFVSSNGSLEALQQALNVLQTAFEKHQTTEFCSVCIDFLQQVPTFISAGDYTEIHQVVQDKTDQLFQLAQQKNILTAELFARWLSLAPSMGYDRDMLVNLSEKCPKSEKTDNLILQNHIQNATKLSELKTLVPKIAKASQLAIRASLTELLLDKYCAVTGPANIKSALSFFEQVFFNPDLPITGSSSSVLKLISRLKGLSEARLLCQKVIAKRVVNKEFYDAWISAEESAHPVDVQMVRHLFQKIVIFDAKSESTWFKWIEFERTHRSFSEAARIYDLAIKSVDNPDSLIAKIF